MPSSGQEGRAASPTGGHQLVSVLAFTCAQLSKAATPTIRRPHMLLARAFRNTSLPALLEKVDALCGPKVREMTIILYVIVIMCYIVAL